MAQLDFLTFYNQIIWVSITFAFLYYLLRNVLIVKLSKIFALRNYISSSPVTNQNNQKTFSFSALDTALKFSSVSKKMFKHVSFVRDQFYSNTNVLCSKKKSLLKSYFFKQPITK